MSRARDIADIHDGSTGITTLGTVTTGTFNGTIGTSASGSANLPAVKTALNASGSAPIYACRAWVHFDGTGTPTIQESGNISSITDLGTGLYTCNFETDLDDQHYVIACSSAEASPSGPMVSDRMTLVARGNNSFSTSGASVHCRDITATTDRDQQNICVAVFR